MFEGNVESLRRVVEAYNARDIDGFIAYFDPNGEFHAAFAVVGGGVYRGHDGVRKFFRDIEDAWGEENGLEPEAYFDLGEHTLAFHVLRARGRHSGAEVTTPVAHVMRWRDGLIVYAKSYVDKEEALRDLGVSESELEPIEP
jgi:ketosteroid isomerase-like protein